MVCFTNVSPHLSAQPHLGSLQLLVLNDPEIKQSVSIDILAVSGEDRNLISSISNLTARQWFQTKKLFLSAYPYSLKQVTYKAPAGYAQAVDLSEIENDETVDIYLIADIDSQSSDSKFRITGFDKLTVSIDSQSVNLSD